MDQAHLLIRTDHHNRNYLIEAVMGAERIILATSTSHADAFTIATNLRAWTRRHPDNVPFPIYDKTTPMK